MGRGSKGPRNHPKRNEIRSLQAIRRKFSRPRDFQLRNRVLESWACTRVDHTSVREGRDQAHRRSLVEPDSTPLTHYVVVRDDLPRGHAVAQTVHAVGETLSGPAEPLTHSVVLSVPNETALVALARSLCASGVPHRLITEPDLGDAATVIGFPPTRDRKALAKFLGRLPLLR